MLSTRRQDYNSRSAKSGFKSLQMAQTPAETDSRDKPARYLELEDGIELVHESGVSSTETAYGRPDLPDHEIEVKHSIDMV